MNGARDAVLAFIDDQDQLGLRVQPTEVLDVLRTLPDHPREEEEALKALALTTLDGLLRDGSIVAYSTGEPEWSLDGSKDLDLLEFAIAPREEDL